MCKCINVNKCRINKPAQRTVGGGEAAASLPVTVIFDGHVYPHVHMQVHVTHKYMRVLYPHVSSAL